MSSIMKKNVSINLMRPKDMYNNYLQLLEENGIDFYAEEKENFIQVNCPACNYKNSENQFLKYGFEHKKCKNCNTLYVSPRPTNSQLTKYYQEYEAPKYWTEFLTKTNTERKYLQHAPRVAKLKNIINNLANEKNIAVDLGAGNGNFTKALEEANIFNKVIASDLSVECAKHCKQQGLETHVGVVDDFENNSLDCITFNDLIEHLFAPEDFIKSCYKKLKKNGLLMLSTPNGEGFDFKIMKENTVNIVPPQHIQFFNPISIETLLKNNGFEVIEITTPGILDVDIIKNQCSDNNLDLSLQNNYLDYIYSLNNPTIEANFQKFLSENNLSSHLLAFAFKK